MQLEQIEKQFKLSNGNILYIVNVEEGYKFVLYTEDKEIISQGILKTETQMSLSDILKELFGYFNISEKEIKNLKPCEDKLPLLKTSEIIEI